MLATSTWLKQMLASSPGPSRFLGFFFTFLAYIEKIGEPGDETKQMQQLDTNVILFWHLWQR